MPVNSNFQFRLGNQVKLYIALWSVILAVPSVIWAKPATGLRLDPIQRSDPHMRDPGYMCSLVKGSRSYLDISSGPPSEIAFKTNGRVVIAEISRAKFRWMQEFGFAVDGVNSSSGSINIGQYTVTMRKLGRVRDLPDGNSLPISVTVSRGRSLATITGIWLCGG